MSEQLDHRSLEESLLSPSSFQLHEKLDPFIRPTVYIAMS